MQDFVLTLIKLKEHLAGQRTTWESHWQELSELGHTKRADFTMKRAKGEKRGRKQFDSTATWSNEVLANGIHGYLFDANTRWFFIRSGRGNLSRRGLRWVQGVEDIMYDIFNDSKTGFHSQAHEMLLDTTSLGTGIMQVSKSLMPRGNMSDGIVYVTRHLGECYLLENAIGMIDGLIRCFKWDSYKVFEKFPHTAPKEIAEEMRDAKPKDYDIIHAILPREKYIPGHQNPKQMAWGSYYVLVQKKTMLSEGGFKSFPFLTPRWGKRQGETYGFSPMQSALPDMKTANEMVKEILEAAQKMNRPPLQLPDNGFVGPIRTMAGGLNYFRAGTKDRIEPLDTGARPDIGMEMLEQIRKSIMRTFYVDAFMQTDDSNGVNVKAQFVHQRRNERFRQMSPMLSRFTTEFLDPCIMRTYELANDMGWLNDAPEEILQSPLKIGYVSPIHRAQKSEDGENLLRLMEMVAPLGETDPSVWQNFDGDAIVRYGANELYNIPVDLLKSPEAVEAFRQKQAEQDQIDTMIQQLQGGAAGLKDASVARKNAVS